MLRVLLATDGSTDAGAAGSLLGQWPLAGRAEVTVLSVVPPLSFFSPELIGPASAGGSAVPQIVQRETDAAGEVAEAAARALRAHGIAATAEVRHGVPASEILQASRDHNADLVVLGSHGRSRLAEFLIGSVSQAVAKHADTSVLVVRDHGAWQGRLLLAIDGSPESDAAAGLLERLPLPPGARCTVLHVLQPLFESGDPRVPQRLAAAERLVERTAAALEKAGFVVEPRVQEGHPAQEILRLAGGAGEGAATMPASDLIVVGARGLTGIKEFLLGSVSGRLLRYAPCSVLIAR